MRDYKPVRYEKFLLDENGNRHKFLFEIDVREALASGKYFLEKDSNDEEVLVKDEDIDLNDNLEIIRK